jgi:peptide/nickel transport system substrate-binding protein
MKKVLIVSLALLAHGASAAPFVFPKAWTAAQPSASSPRGVLREGLLGDYRTFNPFTETGQVAIGGTSGARGLFINDPTNGELLPYMAESYSLSENKLKWTVNVRQGMRWSDGTPITAADWVVTAELHGAPDTLSNQRDRFFIDGKRVDVTQQGDYTLVFTFPKVVANAFETLTVPPAPAHVFRGVYASRGVAGLKAMWNTDENPRNIVTAGAFKLSRYELGNRATFERNPYFAEWNVTSDGVGLPHLEAVEQPIYKDRAALVADYLKGQLDILTSTNPVEVEQLQGAIRRGELRAALKLNAVAQNATTWLTFNWNKKSDPFKQELFRNVNFRQAISHLFDRKRIVAEAYAGLSKPQYGAFTDALGDWVAPDAARFEFDLEAARTLLARVGFRTKNENGYLVNRDGRVLEFEIVSPTATTVYPRIMAILDENAKKVGVKLNLKYITTNAQVGLLTSTGADRPWDAIFSALAINTPSAYPLNPAFYACNGRFHFYNASGSCVDPLETQTMVLYERGRQTLDLTARKGIAHKLQEVYAQLQPMIHVSVLTSHHSWLEAVRGELTDTRSGSTRWLELSWVQR